MKKLVKPPPPEDMVAFWSDENYCKTCGFPEGWFMFYSVSASKVVTALLEHPHTEDGEALLRLIWKENGKEIKDTPTRR